jgi:hypothetical protein
MLGIFILISTVMSAHAQQPQKTQCPLGLPGIMRAMDSQMKAIDDAKTPEEQCSQIREANQMLDQMYRVSKTFKDCSSSDVANYQRNLATMHKQTNDRSARLVCKPPDVRGELLKAYTAVKAYIAEWDKLPTSLALDAGYKPTNPKVSVVMNAKSGTEFVLVADDGKNHMTINQNKEFGK